MDIGGVSAPGLQSPDEAGRLVGQPVYVIQPIDKFPDLGMVGRMEEPPDVQLGEVEGHASIVAQPITI